MKKIISIVLAVVMVMTSLVTFMISGVADDSTETSTRTASYAVQKPVIDGAIDDIWNTTQQLDFTDNANLDGYSKVLWDQSGLYVLTVVNKTASSTNDYFKAVTFFVSETNGVDSNENEMSYWWLSTDSAYSGNHAWRAIIAGNGYPEATLLTNLSGIEVSQKNPVIDSTDDAGALDWSVVHTSKNDSSTGFATVVMEMYLSVEYVEGYRENDLVKFLAYTSDYESNKTCGSGISGTSYTTNPKHVESLKLISNSDAKISGVSLGIGSDLTVNYYATVNETYIKESEAANVKMRFTRNGKSVTVGGEYDSANSRYLFSYTGITPQCIGDNIKAELLYKDKTIATKDSYSVLEYCQTLHADSNTGTELKTLIADLLEYGAAAQKYMNYNTENLVNTDDWVITEKTEFVVPETTAPIIEGSIDQNNKFTSVGVSLSNVNQIFFRFKVEDAENAKITIQKGSGEKVEVTSSEWIADGDTYLVYTNAISATGHDTSYAVSLTVGEQTQSVSYSINSYVSAKYEDAEVGELVKALYNLGVSAQAYK